VQVGREGGRERGIKVCRYTCFVFNISLTSLSSLPSSYPTSPHLQAVSFDHSGQYLGVAAGTGTKVFLAKEWSVVADFKDHSDKVRSRRGAGAEREGVKKRVH